MEVIHLLEGQDGVWGNTNGNVSSNSTSYATSTNYIHADVRDLEAVNGNFYAATDGFLCKSTDVV